MTAQWPAVKTRLVNLLPTLDGWDQVEVFDGAAYDPAGDFATVGHASDGVTTTRGSYQKTLAEDGFRYVEQGSVACTLAATEGDASDNTDTEAVVFACLDSLEGAIRGDKTLGVLSTEGYVDLHVDITAMQTIREGVTGLAFSVDYFTVT